MIYHNKGWYITSVTVIPLYTAGVILTASALILSYYIKHNIMILYYLSN